jgi:hypothetical protein
VPRLVEIHLTTTILDIIIYLCYNTVLEYAQDKDEPTAFAPMTESTMTGLDNGDTITWKLSTNPGTLTAIKIKMVSKKDDVTLPSGSWKSQWIQKPAKISTNVYQGQPNGAGATEKDPFHFAYDVDYQVASVPSWTTLDPDVRIPSK